MGVDYFFILVNVRCGQGSWTKLQRDTLVLSVHGGRGGVGRSTVSFGLASKLAKLGMTALIEMDFSNPYLANLIETEEPITKWTNDYLVGDITLREALINAKKAFKDIPHDFLMACANPLEGARRRMEVLNAQRDKKIAKTLMNETWRIDNKRKLEYVVIDTPVWSDYILASITMISNMIIYVMRPNKFEALLLKERYRKIYQNYTIPIILLINYCPKPQKEMIKNIIKELEIEILPVEIFCIEFDPELPTENIGYLLYSEKFHVLDNVINIISEWTLFPSQSKTSNEDLVFARGNSFD